LLYLPDMQIPEQSRGGYVRHPRFHEHSEVSRCDIIGDIHGCYDELAELLAGLGHEELLDPSLEHAAQGSVPGIVFVGDIVDRGDRIMDAVKLVYRLCTRGHALSVIGNHDDRFLRWMMGRKIEPRHGLQESIDEFESMKRSEREDWRDRLIDFYSNLPWAIRLDAGRLIVAHAAWHADLHEAGPDKLRAYTLYGPTTGRKTPEGFPERIDWAPGYRGPELVVFGHQVYDAPYIHEHAIGIDTGCVFGGALTALRYPELQVLSVRSRGARYSKSGTKMM
jgi:protein phosphatase